MRLLGIIFSLILLATTPILAATLSGNVVAVADGQAIQTPDKEKAEEERFQQLREKAESGDVKAQLQMGYESKGDCKENYKWYLKAAEQGDAEAQFNVASILMSGWCGIYGGDSKRVVDAKKWMRRAAEQGLAIAQWHLSGAIRYSGGQDWEESYYWYLVALDALNKGTITELHYTMPFLGPHVQKDEEMEEAIKNRLTREQMSKVEERAKQWKPVSPNTKD